MTSAPSRFILSLPKAELHLHLEGSIEPATLLELRLRHGMDRATLAEAEQLYNYSDFNGFLMAFKDVTGHLQTPEDYELITYRLMERLKSENILHAEVFVSVGICLWRNQNFPAIFEGLERGRERGERDFGISLLWIFDAVRQFGAEKAQAVVDLDPGDLAAKEDVVLGLPMKRRVESPGGDVDIVRLAGHGAGEGRAAVTAERAARA